MNKLYWRFPVVKNYLYYEFWQILFALQQRIWSPSCRPTMDFQYKVRPLLSEDRSAWATTAMAAASRSLPQNVSRRPFNSHSVWLCISIAAHSLRSLFPSGLPEHTQHELHLCGIRQRAGGLGQRVVELCCGAEARRQQSDTVKGSTTVVADGI